MKRIHNRAKMAAYMTYFGCSPRKGTKGGGREGGQAKYEEAITAALSLSAPPEIASKERKKDGGDQKEEGRFWFKVWCKVRGRRERGAVEKVTEGEGKSTRGM